MADCVICKIIKGEVPAKKIYEDDDILAFLDVNGAAEGHTFVVPKHHYPIFEQVPDPLVGRLFSVSNKISTALFETLNVQGTNLFVTNGVSAGQSVAHFVINIIPRKEGDGINLQWQTRQLSEEEMSTVELKLKDGAAHVGVTESEDVIEKPIEKRKVVSGREEDYLWRSVNKKIG
ncbi:HIT domain-containing protein [Candidatus Woesearchaeota archaeon]|nr:HIT domain-containing protein [Candidatus Woesearchaeota archaeon]